MGGQILTKLIRLKNLNGLVDIDHRDPLRSPVIQSGDL